MKRRVLVASVALLVVACGPVKEPKQASQPDPTAEASGGDSSSSSSAGAAGSSGAAASSSKGRGEDILVPPPAGVGGDAPRGAAPGGKPVKGAKGEAPTVEGLGSFQEGLRWGTSHADVTKVFTENGGLIWKDYDDKLKKARVGPEMTAIEAERESKKAAFARSYLEFKDTPTGYDATGIRGEYTYRNRESLMWIEREGKPKRYFFFIGDRLWKIYDEVVLSDSGAFGKSFVDAVNTMNAKLGAHGRILAADPAKGITATTVDYKDAGAHLRLVDRAGEKIVGVALEDANTLANLASLRAVKGDDPNTIDPTVAAVTKGGLSDPNAPSTAPSGSGKAGKPLAKKKK